MINYLSEIRLAQPHLLWLLLLLPLYWLFYYSKLRKQYASVRFSSLAPLANMPRDFWSYAVHLPVVLRSGALALLMIILARPQTQLQKQSVDSEGIDIVLALDISTSMLAEDFKPNRFKAAQQVAKTFIQERPNDRIGLVVFAGESFTQCPITLDHDVLLGTLEDLKMGIIHDGTALGNGLTTAIDRLEQQGNKREVKSKVVIILTDGVNNQGEVDPDFAAESAKRLGIRVYTIGVGTNGLAPYPFEDRLGGKWYRRVPVEIDEKLLKSIASETGGDYFRATDNEKLNEIFSKIDQLEKTRIEVASFRNYQEAFMPFALLGLCFFMLEMLWRYVLVKRLP